MLNFSLKTLKGWLLKRKKRKMVTYVAVRNVCVVVEKLKTGHMSPKNVNKHKHNATMNTTQCKDIGIQIFAFIVKMK